MKDNNEVNLYLEAKMTQLWRSRVSYIWILLAVLVALLANACGGGGDEGTTTPTPPVAGSAAHPWEIFNGVQAYFVDNTYRVVKSAENQDFTDDPKNYDPIFALIAEAQISLDIAVLRINRQEFVDAVLAKASQVPVRIVTEKAYAENNLYRPFMLQLDAHPNIDVRTDNDGEPRLMHSRFMIADGAKVVVGSYNWSVEGSERTMGDVLIINNAGVVGAFEDQFNQMFVEGRFGAEKRDSIQHAFSVAGGTGVIEVYFGPTDQLSDLLLNEIEQSQAVVGVVQQFSSVSFANLLGQWLAGSVGLAPPDERLMFLIVNDVGAFGDAQENAIYDYLVSLIAGDDAVPAILVINQPPSAPWVSVGAQVNDKILYADHAMGSGVPAVAVSTGNWTDQGFGLNDEAMVILRGSVLSTKYHYIFWMQVPNYGGQMVPADVRETGQLFLMYPFVTNGTGTEVPRDPALADVSTGLVHGRVRNFIENYTYQNESGDMETIPLDIQWTVSGEYFFGGTIGGYVYPTFDENEFTNPDHSFVLVVPAGRVTVTCVVVDSEGNPLPLFEPQQKQFDIGPGGVRHIDFDISAPQIPTGGGPGGGGGGGGGGGM